MTAAFPTATPEDLRWTGISLLDIVMRLLFTLVTEAGKYSSIGLFEAIASCLKRVGGTGGNWGEGDKLPKTTDDFLTVHGTVLLLIM